jgi:hypothetical protein
LVLVVEAIGEAAAWFDVGLGFRRSRTRRICSSSNRATLAAMTPMRRVLIVGA